MNRDDFIEFMIAIAVSALAIAFASMEW